MVLIDMAANKPNPRTQETSFLAYEDEVLTGEEPDLDDPRLYWQVEFTWREIDGRSEIIGMRFWNANADNPEPLTDGLIRGVRWGRLMQKARRKLISAATGWADPSFVARGVERLGGDIADDQAHADGLVASLKEPKRRSYEREHYEKVARIYDTAMGVGVHPTRLVAEELGLNRNVAGKHVAVARKMGLLPPTEKRKKRGNPSTEEETS